MAYKGPGSPQGPIAQTMNVSKYACRNKAITGAVGTKDDVVILLLGLGGLRPNQAGA
jgi:hypothetical protein